MVSPTTDRLAVLIDADNAQPSIASELLAEVSKYGTASIKRAYGDWTTPNLRGWKDVLHALAIQPVQQFSYTTGKNATDSALIIDAMDLLHAGSMSAFCLVSSDSDFTRLATRIRESGRFVYGFGERKTPVPFVKACDRFVYTEILKAQPKSAVPAEEGQQDSLRSMILTALIATGRENGWAILAAFAAFLTRANPSFDPRNYGYQKLIDLVRGQSYLEVKEEAVGAGTTNSQHFVRYRGQA